MSNLARAEISLIFQEDDEARVLVVEVSGTNKVGLRSLKTVHLDRRDREIVESALRFAASVGREMKGVAE